MTRSWLIMITMGLFVVNCAIAAEDHPGAATYRKHCAECHDQPDQPRVPPLAALQQMTARTLAASLAGVMAPQAAQVPRSELRDLIAYLAAPASASQEWIEALRCPAEARHIPRSATVRLASVGVDPGNQRALSAGQAGLTSNDLSHLELAWALGFPETSALRSSPVIIGDTLIYAINQAGVVIALDVRGPCVRWVYDAGMELRTSLTHGQISHDQAALLIADRAGQIHAIDPASGTVVWVVQGRHSSGAMITGAPMIHDGRIIIPVSGSGVGRAVNPRYECCVEHGAVVALEGATGEQLWTWHTMPDAIYTGKENRDGIKLRGPSGAPVWSTPTIDTKRRLVYVTTGQNTSLPATETSDAVIALSLDSGEQQWHFQALANDVWNMACRVPWERSGPNCPSPDDSVLKDFDFGASAILVTTKSGREMLLAGQKSGDVWGLDAASGELIWHNRFGLGTPLGGVHWGMAVSSGRLFVPINDPAFNASVAEPGMNAIDIETGRTLWRTPVAPDCTPERKARATGCERRYGLSAAPLAVADSVVAATIDGRVFVYDAVTGKVQFTYDTLRDFETVNGVPARGGAIDSHSIAAGAGMLFIGSGYGSFGQPPGNVLLAFRPAQADAK